MNNILFITIIFVLSWITIIIIGQVIRDIIKDVTTRTILEVNADNLENLEKIMKKLMGGENNAR